jgi:hypothetical protein
MPSIDYVSEKVATAVGILCDGTDSFEDRIFDAYTSSLTRLTSSDPKAEFADELNWILSVCQRHMIPNAGRMRTFSVLDRRLLCQKLVHLLIRTSQLTVPA